MKKFKKTYIAPSSTCIRLQMESCLIASTTDGIKLGDKYDANGAEAQYSQGRDVGSIWDGMKDE